MSPARDASAELSVPSISTIVECEMRRPLCEASADFASGVSRLFASETPLETENQPATAQTISEQHERAEREPDAQPPARALRRRRARAAVVGDAAALALVRGAHARGADGRHLALRATAAVHAVGLLFPRHSAG